MTTREKFYEPRGQDPRERRGGGRSFRGRRRGPRKKKPYDKGGTGTEIVRELSVCPSCAAEHADTAPEHVQIPRAVDFEAAAASMEAAEGAVTEVAEAETVEAAT